MAWTGLPSDLDFGSLSLNVKKMLGKKMVSFKSQVALGVLMSVTLIGCSKVENSNPTPSQGYTFKQSQAVWVTSEQGQNMASVAPISFENSQGESTTRVQVFPDRLKQTLYGVGSSFTESSAFVLAHLTAEKRQEVMDAVYSADGANFPLARTHIGATDFSVFGKYSYADVADDRKLEHFTIAPDKQGFDVGQFPDIKDPSFDLLPMIKMANQIKQREGQQPISIVASAWTAPAWMKDIETWFIPGTAETNHQGTGGSLKPGNEALYADYLVKYLHAYQEEGVPIWSLTPVNEPHGNSGQWESMHFTAESQRDFIKQHLGPKLAASPFADIKLLAYDQNRDGLEHWADVILGDKDSAQYVYGMAVHWYESTFKVYEDALEATHKKFPQHTIIHTEGTIDDLGKPAPQGIADPEGFQESGWFANDDFWWNPNATDWAYTAEWAPNPEDHPKYTPVHRYARNIIVSFNHWMNGWIDWNIVLDKHGGPNHVGNYCGAPIMIDTQSGEVYYTPIFHVLKQFSRTIRPGDRAVKTVTTLGTLPEDTLHASASVNHDNLLSVQLLNTSKSPLTFDLQVADKVAKVDMPANALKTIQIQLD